MNSCVICGKANRCDDDGQQMCSLIPLPDIDPDVRRLIPVTDDTRDGVLVCGHCENLHVHKSGEVEDEN